MSMTGTVTSWDTEEGWGVIESAATPGGCWLHFSAWLADGRQFPRTGEPVSFVFEEATQDGYDFRAVEAWPHGSEPVRRAVAEDGTAYASFGWITFTGAGGEQVTEQL